jgi:heme iron utilization protein
MSWISQPDWRAAEPDPLGPSAAGIIAHINADQADAMVLYCKAFSHVTEVTSAKMTGVDRYGFDVSAITSNGPRPARLAIGKARRSNEATLAADARA